MRIDEEYPWGIQGTAWRHMKRNRFLVVSRYMEPNKRPPAAVVEPYDDPALGFRTTRYPNNKVNFLACTSLAEADFIAAYANSSPAHEAIARRSSSTTIAPATLNGLYLPRFNPGEQLHLEISAIGQECRVSPRAWPALLEPLDELVASLLAAR